MSPTNFRSVTLAFRTFGTLSNGTHGKQVFNRTIALYKYVYNMCNLGCVLMGIVVGKYETVPYEFLVCERHRQ
jgi:uncharacterized protein YutD